MIEIIHNIFDIIITYYMLKYVFSLIDEVANPHRTHIGKGRG